MARTPPKTPSPAPAPVASGPPDAAPRGSDGPPSAVGLRQEVDVWWGAYAGRAMLPHFLAAAVVSAGVSLLAWWLWDEERADPQLMWHAAMGLVVVVWLVPLCCWVYRTVAYNYRLTTHHLFRDRGFFSPADGQVPLERVAAVRVEAGPCERWLGVGRVRVEYEGSPWPLVLDAVLDPGRVAGEIERRAERARGQGLRDVLSG